MSWLENGSRAGRVAIVAAICLGLATPVVAGTVYSWRSDDGILSFTDEAKRIPARYRKAAKKRSLKKLGSYDRYTPAGQTAEGSYAERLERRQAQLQPASPVVSSPMTATGSTSRASSSLSSCSSRDGGAAINRTREGCASASSKRAASGSPAANRGHWPN